MTIDLTAPGSVEALKSKPFVIKEGAKFRMKANFVVQHDVLSGLKYLQVVKRKGIRVGKNEEMIVSFWFGSKGGGSDALTWAGRARSRRIQRRSLCMRRSVSLRSRLVPASLVLTVTPAVEPDEAPTGMLARGHYEAVSKFQDDDDHDYLKFEWSFDITKEWK